MQLHRVPPRLSTRFPGTSDLLTGVPIRTRDPSRVEPELSPRAPGEVRPVPPVVEAEREGIADATARRGVQLRSWALCGLACIALLGQGERFDVDTRFLTPSRTLETYWGAIRSNDLATVGQCFVEPQESLPFPGMLWFLPPVDELVLRSVHVVSATSDEIVAAYEVEFLPAGSREEQSFITTTRLARIGFEWRILPRDGEAALPAWKPYPRAVDS